MHLITKCGEGLFKLLISVCSTAGLCQKGTYKPSALHSKLTSVVAWQQQPQPYIVVLHLPLSPVPALIPNTAPLDQSHTCPASLSIKPCIQQAYKAVTDVTDHVLHFQGSLTQTAERPSFTTRALCPNPLVLQAPGHTAQQPLPCSPRAIPPAAPSQHLPEFLTPGLGLRVNQLCAAENCVCCTSEGVHVALPTAICISMKRNHLIL